MAAERLECIVGENVSSEPHSRLSGLLGRDLDQVPHSGLLKGVLLHKCSCGLLLDVCIVICLMRMEVQL